MRAILAQGQHFVQTARFVILLRLLCWTMVRKWWTQVEVPHGWVQPRTVVPRVEVDEACAP